MAASTGCSVCSASPRVIVCHAVYMSTKASFLPGGPIKNEYRISEAANLTLPRIQRYPPMAQDNVDSKGKKVWRPCERCRMKKTKVTLLTTTHCII